MNIPFTSNILRSIRGDCPGNCQPGVGNCWPTYRRSSPVECLPESDERLDSPDIAILINVAEFRVPLLRRDGSEGSALKLEMELRRFGIHTVKFDNPSGQDMRELLRTHCSQPSPRGLLVVVMSHGNSNSIMGSDGELVPIQDLLLAANTEALRGVPKVFIIQSCRGLRHLEDEGDRARTVEDPLGFTVDALVDVGVDVRCAQSRSLPNRLLPADVDCVSFSRCFTLQRQISRSLPPNLSSNQYRDPIRTAPCGNISNRSDASYSYRTTPIRTAQCGNRGNHSDASYVYCTTPINRRELEGQGEAKSAPPQDPGSNSFAYELKGQGSRRFEFARHKPASTEPAPNSGYSFHSTREPQRSSSTDHCDTEFDLEGVGPKEPGKTNPGLDDTRADADSPDYSIGVEAAGHTGEDMCCHRRCSRAASVASSSSSNTSLDISEFKDVFIAFSTLDHYHSYRFLFVDALISVLSAVKDRIELHDIFGEVNQKMWHSNQTCELQSNLRRSVFLQVRV